MSTEVWWYFPKTEVFNFFSFWPCYLKRKQHFFDHTGHPDHLDQHHHLETTWSTWTTQPAWTTLTTPTCLTNLITLTLSTCLELYWNDNLQKKKCFTMMISKKNCLGQQFAKILCETTICQKRLSGIVIYKVCKKKKVIRNNICKKWSIATIWNNIIRNNNLLRKTMAKFTKNIQNTNLHKKLFRTTIYKKKLSRR